MVEKDREARRFVEGRDGIEQHLDLVLGEPSSGEAFSERARRRPREERIEHPIRMWAASSPVLDEHGRERRTKHGTILEAHGANRSQRVDRRRDWDGEPFASQPPEQLVDHTHHGHGVFSGGAGSASSFWRRLSSWVLTPGS